MSNKSRRKEYDIVWENNNRGYFKDKNGDVWMFMRTPYKEIPIIITNWKKEFEIKSNA